MKRFYVSSRTLHARMWQKYRIEGVQIISTWIDEIGAQAVKDYDRFWKQVLKEIDLADTFVLYAEPVDFPLRGALIEAGVAIASKMPVIICLPQVTLEPETFRPIGSWINHPLVKRNDNISRILREED